MGGGGQGSARGDLSSPGSGFGHSSGGGDGVEVCGVSDVTHLVFRLQQETSGQGRSADEKRRQCVHTHTSSGQLLSTQSCRCRSKPLEHLKRGEIHVRETF